MPGAYVFLPRVYFFTLHRLKNFGYKTIQEECPAILIHCKTKLVKPEKTIISSNGKSPYNHHHSEEPSDCGRMRLQKEISPFKIKKPGIFIRAFLECYQIISSCELSLALCSCYCPAAGTFLVAGSAFTSVISFTR